MSIRPVRFFVPLALLALPLFATLAQDPDEGDGPPARDEGGEVIEDRLRPLPESPRPIDTKPGTIVRDAERERGSPFLVPLDGGRAWLGALEWEAGAGDRIVVRELDPGGAVARSIVVQEAPAEIVRPVGVLDRDGRLLVIWTELVDDAAQLRLARLDGETFGAAVTLTRGPHPNSNVEAALHAGDVWLAWESYVPPAKEPGRGSVDVVLAKLVGDRSQRDEGRDDGDERGDGGAAGLSLGPILRAGDARGGDVDPVLTSSADRLFVAWSSFTGRDYEVLLRSLDPRTGELSPAANLTLDGSADDLHPSLLALPTGELWLAWDRIEDATRGSSLPESLRPEGEAGVHAVHVMTARIRDAATAPIVELPASLAGWPAGAVAGAPKLSWMGGVPKLAQGGDGRPWIAYRYLQRPIRQRVPRFGEPVLVQRFGTEGWSRALEIAGSIGHAEEPALAGASGGVFCAAQHDLRLDDPRATAAGAAPAALRAAMKSSSVDVVTWYGPTGICLAKLDAAPDWPGDASARSPVAITARPDRSSSAHFHPPAAALADPKWRDLVHGDAHFEVVRGEDRWRVYWGDLHRHSSVSRCARGHEPTAGQRYQLGRDVHLYDFMAMTDHAGQIDPLSWWQLDKMLWLFKNRDYVPLAGFEVATRQFGHHNVILDGRLTPLVAVAAFQDEPEPGVHGIERLYARLPIDRSITIPHTPADSGRQVVFQDCDDGRTRLLEIYQALRGSCEFEGCLRQSLLADAFGSFAQDALQVGRKVGFVASTDHGNGASYAGVLAEKLDGSSLFEALRSRRTFGATTKGLFIDLRVDDAVMGEEIVASGPPNVRVSVRAPGELAEVVVFRSGRPWQAVGRELGGRSDVVGLTLEFDPPFTAKGPALPWTLALTVEDGIWLDWPSGRRAPRSPRGGFSADGSTVTFTWPAGFTGFKKSDLRVRLRARRDATVTFESGGERRSTRVTGLLTRGLRGRADTNAWSITAYERFDDSVDLARGLGVHELDHEWPDEAPLDTPVWYYARAVQTDGEMAWSSPIWVSPAR